MEQIEHAYNLILSNFNYASYKMHLMVNEHLTLNLTLILFLGALAQWIAWRYHFPSIAFLLFFGFLAGPVGNLIDPDALFGKTFIPIVSLSVAFILFEGALSLKFSEVVTTKKVVRDLVTAGALVTLVLSAAAAYYILNLDFSLSLLFGSILTVTGPTVIMPLLRHIKPIGKISAVLKWEGIVIDPIGAILAVLVYQAIITGQFHSVYYSLFYDFMLIFLVGSLTGLAGAGVFYQLLKHYLVPEYLQNPFTLALVSTVFTASNLIKEESGLLAITVMGIALANQRRVDVKNILVFKENLRVLLISILFILLSARLKISDFDNFNSSSFLFIVILIFVIRPACVFISSIKSNLNFYEKLFISFMAPRGIIAASVSSVFALNLVKAGHKSAEILVPLTFMVIIATVLFYSIVSPWLANRLKLSNIDPQSVIIIGAQPPAVKIAFALKEAGFQSLLIDNNALHVKVAAAEGLTACTMSILDDNVIDEIDMNAYGKVLALTSNDKVNSLSIVRFCEHFERHELYQISSKIFSAIPQRLTGRTLFRANFSYDDLQSAFERGAQINNIKITPELTIEELKKQYGEDMLILFRIDDKSKLIVNSPDMSEKFEPKIKSIIALCAS